MKLHMVGLPHTQTVVEDMTTCAFTQKIVKFGEMMTPLGYEIVLYSGEHNDTICAEHVPVFTDEQQRAWYPDHDQNLLATVATWGAELPHWVQMNHRAIAEISQRIEPEDLVLILAGLAQKPIADAFPANIACEWAAGYSGIFSEHVCFESYAWMHYLYGLKFGDEAGGRGRFFDAVIPNYFRPGDFEMCETDVGDYLLFVGRVTRLKGPTVAAEIAQATGRKLIVAGPGVDVERSEPGRIVANEGFELVGDVEYAGVVDVATRNELMRNAWAILVPSLYLEPFGAVNVEAQMCGTPAIAPDWGAFPETIEHGVSGFRFRTLAEAARAVDAVAGLNRGVIRERAVSRYSLEAIAPLYDNWFGRLSSRYRKGWYEGTPQGDGQDMAERITDALHAAGVDVTIGLQGPANGETEQDTAEAPGEAEGPRDAAGDAPGPVYVTDPDRPHLGGYIAGGDPATQTPDLWRWLVDELGVRSVLDVGCGEGHALRAFRELGCYVVGVDGIAQEDPDIFEHDFAAGPLIRNGNGPLPRFDLCWSSEFVEHVDAEHEENFLTAFERAELVAMTHALPGQAGYHHVNCQPKDYWIRRLREHGFKLDNILTAKARIYAGPNTHFARTGLVLRRKPINPSNRSH